MTGSRLKGLSHTPVLRAQAIKTVIKATADIGDIETGRKMSHLEEVVQIIAEILHKVHVAQQWQDLFLDLSREGHFGLWQPGPVIRV